MTASQALHLIEQFSAQAPFAIWITDSRGVAIFANRKLHDILGLQQKPSGAVGMNLFNDPSIEALGLGPIRDRLRQGDVIDETIDIPEFGKTPTHMATTREGRAMLRVIAYPLFSSSNKIEHYVMILTDITAAAIRADKLRSEIRDIEVFNASRKTRQAKEAQLETEAARLEAELKALGGKP